jgi:hypothetical protein
MTNIFTFEPKPKPQPKPPTFQRYASEFIVAFDYRGAWAFAPAGLQEQAQDILDLATGSLIASRLKRDAESAAALSSIFASKTLKNHRAFRLKELPEFARGYVWSYKGSLLVQARLEAQFGSRT